ncbi:glycosyltransferase [Latilactobacillus curvatus]|uniref:glycosyltransferase family 2 protein n=1 Tax=Latilactobacillus curvatus TaxID=28038 RepID=UPI000976EDBA|nr:glycosyltransferase [Latilactobacillus curvatus]MCT3524978.1 glycosyltransferase [Latilactobacillus curvatus]UTB70914.1 hypothetical protein A4W71_07440 [Latilactobacillus curvatus]UTB73810.1 hypothetical protein A4W73_02670 [Latilactobacillus curvatus]UTY79712.1 hypothetical protein A4W76_02690 [Latilactobacillus curvatus]
MVEVSILMATRNGEKHIREAIDSLLNQTFRDFELVVCNDHSTDNTVEIISDYMKSDSRVTLIHNAKKPGLTTTLNIGLDNCNGKYIVRMDDDDISHSDRIEKEYRFMENNMDIAVVGSNINYFDQNGVYGVSDFKSTPNSVDIWKDDIFAHPTVMIRADVINNIGGYDESNDVIRIEDYDYWCKLYSEGYRGVNLREVLLDYREDNNAFKKRNNIRRIRLVRRMNYWSKPMGIHGIVKGRMLYELLKCMVPQKAIQMYHKIIYKK